MKALEIKGFARFGAFLGMTVKPECCCKNISRAGDTVQLRILFRYLAGKSSVVDSVEPELG